MNRREFICNTGLGLGAMAGAAASLSAGKAAGAAGKGRLAARGSMKRRPNIVIIMADDMGYGDLGCFGSELISTPNIDRLAGEGVKLESFYSCAAICAPSRSGLMTGRYPIRNGVTMNFYPSRRPLESVSMHLLSGIGWGMDTREITLAQALKPAGYAAACIGKWHLGDIRKYRPHHRGFDHYMGVLYSNDGRPLNLYRMDEVIEEHPVDQNYLTQKYTREAVRFIDDNRDRPFLLYLPHTFPHIPLHASPEFRGRSRGGLYGDTVEEIDWSTGEIMAALERHGLGEDTFVFFTSDNGPWYQGSTQGYRGRKNEAFEGGMRVPAIARWPGVIPAGGVSSEMSMNFDLFATAVGLAGSGLPADRPIDGKNIMPMLNGGPSPHKALFFYWLDNLHAVRVGRWKYHRPHRFWSASFFFAKKGPMLFDVEEDPYESYNLIDRHPDKARELEELMREWESNLVKGLPEGR